MRPEFVELDNWLLSRVTLMLSLQSFVLLQRLLWKLAVFRGGHFKLLVHLIFPVVGRASCA